MRLLEVDERASPRACAEPRRGPLRGRWPRACARSTRVFTAAKLEGLIAWVVVADLWREISIFMTFSARCPDLSIQLHDEIGSLQYVGLLALSYD